MSSLLISNFRSRYSFQTMDDTPIVEDADVVSDQEDAVTPNAVTTQIPKAATEIKRHKTATVTMPNTDIIILPANERKCLLPNCLSSFFIIINKWLVDG